MTSLNEEEIFVRKNEVFLLPTRLVASGRDLEEDISDVSDTEGVIPEADISKFRRGVDQPVRPPLPSQSPSEMPDEDENLPLNELIEQMADRLGYDVDGRDAPDDALYDSIEEAANLSTFKICGNVHEMECIVLWDYFGGNNYDDLNVHAGDTVLVVAEEYQVRVVGEETYLRIPFQLSLARWQTERPVNPYLGLIPSHYIVSKQFYRENPLLFKWPAWYHGNAEVHEVIHKLYGDRSALCPGLFAIFSPDWLNIDFREHRCYLLMILKERDQKHDDQLKELLEAERKNYCIMADSIDHIYGEMLPENIQDEKTVMMQRIEFISEVETTPFAPSVIPIHRSPVGHFELMDGRYETLYDLVHHLATHRSALPHKLVYCRSSPLIVGRNVVPPPTQVFKKDLRAQPMAIEQWAAAHFDAVTRRSEGDDKLMYATKTIFDGDKKSHKETVNTLELPPEEVEKMTAYARKFAVKGGKNWQRKWDEMPLHETAIRIKSPFYVEPSSITEIHGELGRGAFGVVKKAKFTRENGRKVPVAVKMLLLKESDADQRNTAFNELEVLEMMSHPNIVFYYGFTIHGTADSTSLFLLAELMDTSLDRFIDKCDAILSENEILDMLAQICRGMSYLHTRTPPVVHGDLAARNVLLKKHPVYHKKYIAKITDFGLAKPCRDELHTNYDDPNKIPFKWLPPEVLTGRTLSLKTDVWAFGIVCFEVCDKMGEPYGACVLSQNLCQYLNDGYRHDKGQHMSDTVYDIALSCMEAHAADRPCFEALMERCLECIIEGDGEDEKALRAREKVMADKARTERIRKNQEKLMDE